MKELSLYDFIQQQIKREHLPTKQKFGEIMYDDSISDEEKLELIERIEAEGGYECLAD